MSITILSQAGCRKTIAKIKSRSSKVQADIHVVAVSALTYVRDHGDTTIGSGLLEALPNGVRVNALAYWFGHFSGGKARYAFNKNTSKWDCKLPKERTVEDFDIDGAENTTFADLTVEKEPTTLTLDALVKYVERKANEEGTYDNGEPKVAADAREFAARVVAMRRADLMPKAA